MTENSPLSIEIVAPKGQQFSQEDLAKLGAQLSSIVQHELQCESGQLMHDTQIACATLAPFTGAGQFDAETQLGRASATPLAVDGQRPIDTHSSSAVNSDLIAAIVETYRQRVDLHRAEKSLTLQIKAKCRRMCEGDKTEADVLYKSMLNGQKCPHAGTMVIVSQPFVDARGIIQAHRAECEKQLTKMAKELHVWPWAESVKGFGALSLASVIGEAGDLLRFDTVSKLWKRMGLAVINGGRQRLVSGAAAIEHGYNPARRSVVWNIGECLIKQQGDYRALYLERMVREVEKCWDEGLQHATTTAATVTSWANRGLPDPVKVSKIDEAKHRSCGHIHNRAKRYVEKRLLRDLWKAWRN